MRAVPAVFVLVALRGGSALTNDAADAAGVGAAIDAYAWVEQQLMQLLARSHAPLGQLAPLDLHRCGCASSARPIEYGAGIGAECARTPPHEEPGWDIELCGSLVCLEPGTRRELKLFCP